MIKTEVIRFVKSKSRVDKHIKHLAYEKIASMFDSNFLYDTKTNWGIVKK